MRVSRFLVLMLLGLACCKERNNVSISGYKEYLRNPNNGLTKTKSIAAIQFDLQYLPPEVLALREGGSGKAYDTLLEQFGKEVYFRLDISPIKSNRDIIELYSKNEEEYNRALQYFTYDFSKNIVLKVGDHIYSPLFCMNEKNYNISKKLTFTLSFIRPLDHGDLAVSIDPVPLNLGKQIFQFKEKDLLSIPKLSI